MKKELQAGQPGCQHSYASGGKVHLQVCRRFCTKCGHSEVSCDNANISEDVLDKIFKEAR